MSRMAWRAELPLADPTGMKTPILEIGVRDRRANMEVEIKVCLEESEVALVEGFAEQEGVVFGQSAHQADVYFKEQGFRTKVQGAGSYLIRVRYSEGGSTLNMKRLTARDGVWEEIESSVADGTVAERILETVGLERAVQIEKERRFAQLGDVELILDHVSGLGVFLELATECSSAAVEVEAAQAKLRGLLVRIGIDERRIELRGYPTIELEKQGVIFTAK